jgi:HAD superfamily hydrolase (TIGR01509 family)
VTGQLHDLDLSDLRVLLCDADGTLFPSEEPAFAASAGVTNAFLASVGVPARFTAEEKRQVTAHLGQVLRPDDAVLGPLGRLAHLRQAAVSSSASARLDACFTATGLDGVLPPGLRYSAEDSLPVPTSKPDPAIYLFAGRELGCTGRQGLAVEDAVPGAVSAVAAGFPTVGNVMFVPPAERAARTEQLRQAGVGAVVDSWDDLATLLLSNRFAGADRGKLTRSANP